jgi:AraC-like DNA-binding protein
MDKHTLKDGFLGEKILVLPDDIKKRVKKNVITRHFFVSDLGYFPKANHHYRKRKKDSSDFIFIYCVEGKGWIKINNKKWTILPNQYFIIPKHEAHMYSANQEDPWSIYWMHFDGTIAHDLYNRYELNLKKHETLPFINDRIKLFNQIFEIFKSYYIDLQLEYASVLSLNFISSFIYNEIDMSVNIHKQDNLVGAIIDFLNRHIDQSFKSSDIAREFNLSKSYIHTLFKKRTGYSLIHFFNLKKVQKACEYLNFTDLSIKEISYKIGIKDPLYFSRVFKNYMGISPREYKKNQHH